MSNRQVTEDFLEPVAQAFNRHDVDGVMPHMMDDCVYLATPGNDVDANDVDGNRFEGHTAVRQAFAD